MLYAQSIDVWRKENAKGLLNKFFPQFTYNSNKMENDETRLCDVEAVFKGKKITDYNSSNKTIKEIINHKELCDNFINICKEYKTKLSIEMIKIFHYTLMKDCFTEKLLYKGEIPGEFKKGDYVVGFHEVGGKASEVEADLNSLIQEVNDVIITEVNALKVVSYFHCWFETIHPFADGNGRVGRMLISYLLIGNNLPPVVIFENDRMKYYLSLEYFNIYQQIDKMVKFLDEQAYKTWVKVVL